MSQPYFRVDLYSHHFVLSRVSPRGREVIDLFARQYIQFGLRKVGRRFQRVPDKVFAFSTANGQEYRFHIHQYQPFIKHISQQEVLPHCYEVVQHTPSTGVEIDLQTLPGWVEQDHQIPVGEYLYSPSPSKIKLLEIQTGKGKTFCAMKAATRYGVRFAVVLRPGFMEKWVSDVKKICGLTDDEICEVKGSEQVMQLLARAKANEITEKVFIVSNRTLGNWYSLYKTAHKGILDMGYAVLPGELFQILGVGLRIIDEVHMDFHLNFRVDLFTNVDRSISLSASMKGDDPFVNRMYELAYPMNIRYAGIAYDRYVTAYSWIYQTRNPRVLRASQPGSSMYSHHAFEDSIIRNPSLLEDYLDMTLTIVRRFYLSPEYVKGDRCLVYFASIDMCTRAESHFRQCLENVDVRRYVEDDPYDNLMDAELCVSTLGSAGTGHDIAGLTTVILTTSVQAHQSNVQGFGRLRKLLGKKVRFVYLVCSDVPRQLDYHEKKKDLLLHMAEDYNSITYQHLLG